LNILLLLAAVVVAVPSAAAVALAGLELPPDLP
jgi:hypothetical protein